MEKIYKEKQLDKFKPFDEDEFDCARMRIDEYFSDKQLPKETWSEYILRVLRMHEVQLRKKEITIFKCEIYEKYKNEARYS